MFYSGIFPSSEVMCAPNNVHVVYTPLHWAPPTPRLTHYSPLFSILESAICHRRSLDQSRLAHSTRPCFQSVPTDNKLIEWSHGAHLQCASSRRYFTVGVPWEKPVPIGCSIYRIVDRPYVSCLHFDCICVQHAPLSLPCPTHPHCGRFADGDNEGNRQPSGER
jgi:hypothetical protein